MPRVAIPVTQPTRAGIAPPAEINGDPANDHTMANNGRTMLIARNADAGGAHPVNIRLNGTVDGQAIADRVISVPLSATRWIGPFPVSQYGSQLLVDVDSAQIKLTAVTVRA